MTSIDLSGVPFDSNFYYVHLHGLDVDDNLSQIINEEMGYISQLDAKLSQCSFGGFCSFFGQFKGVERWTQFLGHKKNRRLIERFQNSETYYHYNRQITSGGGRVNLSRALNFLDDHTIGPTKSIYSLILVNPKLLGSELDPKLVSMDNQSLRAFYLFEINIICQMLRILGFKIITPFISNIPYSDFFNYNSKQNLVLVPLDDAEIRRHYSGNVKKMGISDLMWIRNNFNWFWENQTDESWDSFSIAFQMITNYIYATDVKVRFSSAWTGIEALLKPGETNIRKNIVHRIVETGLISKTKANKIWTYRCDVIHGDIKGDRLEKIPEMAEFTHDLLCKLTKYMIENKIIPTKKILDDKYGSIESNCKICNGPMGIFCKNDP